MFWKLLRSHQSGILSGGRLEIMPKAFSSKEVETLIKSLVTQFLKCPCKAHFLLIFLWLYQLQIEETKNSVQHFNILRWTPQQKSAWISAKILLAYLLLTVVETLLRSKVHFSESFMQNKCDYHATTVELTNREMHSYLILIISPDKHIGLVLLLLYFCNFSQIRHGEKKERKNCAIAFAVQDKCALKLLSPLPTKLHTRLCLLSVWQSLLFSI